MSAPRPDGADAVAEVLDLADWRRQVHDLYAMVRRLPPEDGWLLWRDTRDRLFGEHPQSPYDANARRDVPPLPYAAYDPAWRFVVTLDPAPAEEAVLGHSAAGGTRARRAGTVTLLLAAGPARLSVWWLDQYGGGLFLPFRDATNGEQTYGGGRYVLDSAKGADLGMVEGRLVVDLNFAYHPSCAYDPAWSCPLAPPDERIPIPVHAGELLAAPGP